MQAAQNGNFHALLHQFHKNLRLYHYQLIFHTSAHSGVVILCDRYFHEELEKVVFPKKGKCMDLQQQPASVNQHHRHLKKAFRKNINQKEVSQNESFVAHPFLLSTMKTHPTYGICVVFWACKSQPSPPGQRFCGSFSVFVGYTVIFSDTRVCSHPCSRFIHSFFRLKASARKNISVRTLALPVVRKRLKCFHIISVRKQLYPGDILAVYTYLHIICWF